MRKALLGGLGAALCWGVAWGSGARALAPGAAGASAVAHAPEFTKKLKRFHKPGFSILLPEGFRSRSERSTLLVDTNPARRLWLWGSVAQSEGRFRDDELDEFADGYSCTARNGQVLVRAQALKTRQLRGAEVACRPAEPGAGSGWIRVLANSERHDFRYVLDFRLARSPEDDEVREIVARIVGSLREPYREPAAPDDGGLIFLQ